MPLSEQPHPGNGAYLSLRRPAQGPSALYVAGEPGKRNLEKYQGTEQSLDRQLAVCAKRFSLEWGGELSFQVGRRLHIHDLGVLGQVLTLQSDGADPVSDLLCWMLS